MEVLQNILKKFQTVNFIIEPALTHSNGSTFELRTGIVNKDTLLPNGLRAIKYITLPRIKYGNSSNSYFPSFNSMFYLPDSTTNYGEMNTHCDNRLRELHQQGVIDFDIDQFLASGGMLVRVFAGSHAEYAGTAGHGVGMGGSTLVRGMRGLFSDIGFKINGISNEAHEILHIAGNFKHALGGRYCLMNPWNTRDINCPSHVNPVFKLMRGWLEPVALENSQGFTDISPIETSRKYGVITLYGKPAAAPDFLSGECLIIENRKRLLSSILTDLHFVL